MIAGYRSGALWVRSIANICHKNPLGLSLALLIVVTPPG
jgi:hypothetical protein